MDRWEECVWGRQIYNIKRFDLRLRSNKGWTPGDNIGTAVPPPCLCDDSSPRDGFHLTQCPSTSRLRPPDIASWVNQDQRISSVLKWAAAHDHFGVTPRTSQVRWISLSRPGNLSRSCSFTCSICSRSFTNKSHLTRHQEHIHPDASSTLFVIGQPHPCPGCTRIFRTKTELDSHTAHIHGCPDCGKRFTEIANMFRHRIAKHGGLLCPGCSQRFESRIGLRIHQQSNCGGSRS